MSEKRHAGGTWEPGKYRTTVVGTELPAGALGGSERTDFYGGYLIAESVAPENVPIISAAPDMLEALEMIRDADEDCIKDGLPRPLTDIARGKVDRAIAKARSEA